MFSSQKLHSVYPSKWVKTLLRRVKTNSNPTKKDSFATMEVSNQLRQVFKHIDANGDGLISSLELKEVLHRLGQEKSKAAVEAEGMVREVDCNGDGYIDIDEFMEVVVVEGEGDDHELREAFRVFDADENGYISAEELRRVLVGLGHGECGLRECARMIRGVDRDGDGRVDFEEFRSMMTSSTRRERGERFKF
ncbi:putative calcium-binding protein CML25 [Acorus calamus]|uniref:Calcium-binding protein CML25 n=1 Tax=Acorus calamus TaxID=4465 RepID=A0AAV9C9H9_ACOCL|nr:putative calcium-binding protein CML25 [Acorus calamus]